MLATTISRTSQEDPLSPILSPFSSSYSSSSPLHLLGSEARNTTNKMERTRVCHGDRRRPLVAEGLQGGRDGKEHQGAGAADDAGPEEGGLLARGPAPVPEGTGPELRRRVGHFFGFLISLSPFAYGSNCKLVDRGWGRPGGFERWPYSIELSVLSYNEECT